MKPTITKRLPILATVCAALLLPSIASAADRQARQFQRLVDEAPVGGAKWYPGLACS